MSRGRGWAVTCAIWLGASSAFVALSSSEASAQRTADVSPELIDAILRYTHRFDGGNVRLLSGRVPEDLASFQVPPGTRVLGSVVYGSSVRVFATTSSPLDSLREFYTRTLAPAGWKPFGWGPRGGFVNSRRDMPVMFCRDGAHLQIQRQPGIGGAGDLVLDYRDGMGPCEESAGMASASASTSVGALRPVPAAAVFRGSIAESTRFPTLYSPDEASGADRARCFPRSGYTGESSTGTRVSSGMTAEELLRHYGKQLQADGWRASAPGGHQAAVGSWTLADSSGAREVTLQVLQSSRAAAGCFEVQMRMSERPR